MSSEIKKVGSRRSRYWIRYGAIEGHVPNLATALHYRRVESLQPNDTRGLVLAVAYLTFEGKMRGEEFQER
jgi:hypothetical protein